MVVYFILLFFSLSFWFLYNYRQFQFPVYASVHTAKHQTILLNEIIIWYFYLFLTDALNDDFMNTQQHQNENISTFFWPFISDFYVKCGLFLVLYELLIEWTSQPIKETKKWDKNVLFGNYLNWVRFIYRAVALFLLLFFLWYCNWSDHYVCKFQHLFIYYNISS